MQPGTNHLPRLTALRALSGSPGELPREGADGRAALLEPRPEAGDRSERIPPDEAGGVATRDRLLAVGGRTIL